MRQAATLLMRKTFQGASDREINDLATPDIALIEALRHRGWVVDFKRTRVRELTRPRKTC